MEKDLLWLLEQQNRKLPTSKPAWSSDSITELICRADTVLQINFIYKQFQKHDSLHCS